MSATEQAPLKRADFKTDQEVRWCPGCGDYAILSSFQKVFPKLGVERENFAVISGIGCSSRFPYYMNTYGFHTIHGRAPTIATGLKLANPDLSVWVITGDGDGLSIGGNHLIHAIRRNVDLKIVLFNNQIYGLTKGQFSPTSEFGKRTKSTPHGSIDTPFKPLSLILGANPSFVARTIDRNPKHMGAIFERAGHWRGNAFVEVYQNCNIFNDGAFSHLTEKETKKEQVVELTHGEPLIFGANDEKAITIEGFTPKVVQLADVDRDSLPVHDEQGPIAYHAMLAQMNAENGFPTPVGVIRAVERPVYDELATAQIETAREKSGKVSIFDELLKGDTWTV